MNIFGKSNNYLIIITLTVLSCTNANRFEKTIQINDAYFKGFVIVKRVASQNRYQISIENQKHVEIDRIFTPYTIFQMETGDVNNDGKTDICIGIIKPTPFDSVLKKRLFIFQIDRNYIRPLWLSSRLAHPFEKCSISKDKNNKTIVRTIERQNKKLYCISEYEWGVFGLTFKKISADSLSYSEADNRLTMNQK